MADVKAIRNRMKTRLEAVGNVANLGQLFVYDTMPSTPTVPCAIITPPPGVFLTEVTFDGVEDLSLVVLVLVTKVVDSVAQDNLDTYLSEGAPNLADAIDSGATVDWDYAMSGPIRGYGQYTFGTGEAAQPYLGFEIPVMVGVS